jgi:DNA-binding helix-hairpin-helix protein with protein kinase domain
MNWKPRKKLRELHQVYQLAKKEWTRAKRQYVPWKRKQEYQRQKEILSSLRKEYQELKHTREQKIKAIQRDYLRTRREEFLRRFPIRHAKSSLITNRVVSILENHGIYTASDIRLAKLERVPRIGNDVKNELIAWRKDLVSRFPKPKRLEVSEQAIQKIEQEMIGKRIRWQKKAIQARDRYLRWSKICYQECAQKIPTLEKKARKLAQAEKDYLFLLERR